MTNYDDEYDGCVGGAWLLAAIITIAVAVLVWRALT